MTTITLPPDIEKQLAEIARQQHTTPEELAISSLRKLFTPVAAETNTSNESLYDFLGEYIGAIDGPAEALSENCSQRFAEGMLDKHRRDLL